MKPILVEGNSIAETWEKALIELWENGIEIETQYDIDPNTGVKHPPSKDCMMMMVVNNALAEPRLHCCLEGGPAELAEYKLEVVDGIKDHWVKLSPEDTKWTYTYHNRLFNWGSQLNFASIPGEGETDNDNPWTQLAYVRKVNGELAYEIIPPADQIQHIIDTLAEAPFSRRGVALTGFPAGDKDTHDPPCLRYVWCRGNYENGYLSIDMHTHWRSRDAFGAALFNMYALTELQRYIVEGVQQKYYDMYLNDEFMHGQCPKCGGDIVQEMVALVPREEETECIVCHDCKLRPYIVKAGRYVDVADSFHIYGHKIKEFENRFINSALKQPYERRFWDLSTDTMKELLQEGEDKAYKMVASLDAKNGTTDLPAVNRDM